jgi:small neutral amino acid transporter SnatA (MarC family)
MALSERRVGLLTADIVGASTQSEAGSATTLAKGGAGKAVILTISALIATQLLHLLSVSLDAFMVAGGGK